MSAECHRPPDKRTRLEQVFGRCEDLQDATRRAIYSRLQQIDEPAYSDEVFCTRAVAACLMLQRRAVEMERAVRCVFPLVVVLDEPRLKKLHRRMARKARWSSFSRMFGFSHGRIREWLSWPVFRDLCRTAEGFNVQHADRTIACYRLRGEGK